jgi:4-hydroxy-2-oxoheptanedioate aldolase
MRENKLRALWKSGGAAVNGWCAIPASFAAETMAHQGWDSLTIDLQHGVVDYQTAVTLLQAISTTGVVPFARVPWLEPGIIMKLLDAGAYGIICPMVNNKADAERFVGACRYVPDGYRSYGPVRALLYGGADYPAHANDTVVTMAMIETQEALDKVDEIMSVKELDGIYIGPADLSLSMRNGPKFDHEDGPVAEAIDHILARAKHHGIIAGIHTGGPEYALKMIAKGFQFVTIASDARLLAAKALESVTKVRDGLKGQKTGAKVGATTGAY